MECINDRSGMTRWTGHILMGKHQRNIPILAAYLPTKKLELQTTYQQQRCIIREQNGGALNPRAQMMTDLKQP
jgi:hypothetical protein